MLSREDNELLVRVGPGTPMGDVMRRYWHPIALSNELPKANSNPVRAKLLGEQFVLFRDSEGRVGMLDELCMHRGASLAIGRVEEGGLRCLYHGWKYAIDGTILETANHQDCRLRQKLKAKAYPIVERSGVIWAYIGPKEQQPPFRSFAADMRSDDAKFVFRVNTKVNYLALWEGGLDSSHVSTLHTNTARLSWRADRGATAPDGPVWAAMDDPAPTFAVEDTAFGYHYSATRKLPPSRSGGEEMRNVRITPAFMPTGRVIGGPNINFLIWETPNDDVSTSTFIVTYTNEGPVNKEKVYKLLGIDDARFWSESDSNFKGSWENNFFQDRDSMDSNYSGLTGILVEDMATVCSYGPIYDRSKEHLVPADIAIVRVRKKLMECVKLVKAGRPPIGVHLSDLTGVTAPDVDVPATTDWRDIAPGHRMLEAAE